MARSSFGRKRDDRTMLLRNLATSVILYESVMTTEARAREVQPIVDRLISQAKRLDRISAYRALKEVLTDENAVRKTLDELVGRFEGQASGFTRRMRVAPRAGDGAPRTLIQLTSMAIAPASVTAVKQDEAYNHDEVNHG
jgi:large subunit ribosomal protein L17